MGAAKSWDPLLNASPDSNSGLPHLQKRQTTVAEGYVCDAVQARAACISGYSEAFANQIAKCNLTTYAKSFEDGCRVNANNVICGGALTDNQRGQAACWMATRWDVETPVCTPDCKDFLIATRDTLGCCSNIYNDSTSPLYEPGPFNHSLWSLCGVEPSTEECPPPPFRVSDNVEIDPTCPADEVDNRFFPDIFCGRQYIESIDDILVASNCENHAADIYEITRDFCTVDNRGHYCSDGVNLYTLSYYAFESCSHTDVCEEGCLTALNNITAMVGCCYVSHFNRTGHGPLPAYLSYEFWQRCGLTSPGFCETRFVDVDLNNSASLLEKTITFTLTFYMLTLLLI